MKTFANGRKMDIICNPLQKMDKLCKLCLHACMCYSSSRQPDVLTAIFTNLLAPRRAVFIIGNPKYQ